MASKHAGLAPPAAEAIAARERIIVALDFPTAERALFFLSDLGQRCRQGPLWVKVGLELFLAEGAWFVEQLRNLDYSVFLDLKLHDIPNTVAASVRSLRALDIGMLTIHASGGPAMLTAAAEAAAALPKPPRLLAVTVLTSMDQDQLTSTGVAAGTSDQVLRLGRLAWQAGVQGLVASSLEAALLRTELGAGLHLVTPGIRPDTGESLDDQRRVATPAMALRSGASQIVVGRPITRAADPAAAFTAMLAAIAEAAKPA